jgi:hypothetical protein
MSTFKANNFLSKVRIQIQLKSHDRDYMNDCDYRNIFSKFFNTGGFELVNLGRVSLLLQLLSQVYYPMFCVNYS